MQQQGLTMLLLLTDHARGMKMTASQKVHPVRLGKRQKDCMSAHLQGALMQQQSLALLLQLAQLGHVAGCCILGLQNENCAV